MLLICERRKKERTRMIYSFTSPKKQPTKASKIEANNPARVPSTLTAPSVPLGTTFKFVTKYLVAKQYEISEHYLHTKSENQKSS